MLSSGDLLDKILDPSSEGGVPSNNDDGMQEN
jgi:hypothetical protein